jgi:hypothetical protein
MGTAALTVIASLSSPTSSFISSVRKSCVLILTPWRSKVLNPVSEALRV